MNRNCFVISVNGLAQGENTFHAHADKEFFAKYENHEVLDADLKVTVVAVKSSSRVELDCSISGGITFPCDRCCSPVRMPVDVTASFVLRLSESSPAVSAPDEEVFLPDGSDALSLDQEVYDYSLLALPLQKIHSEGECDEVALAFLSEDQDGEAPAATSSPFSSLAEMLSEKLKKE